MSRFKELLKDKKLMSGIYAVTLVTALLILALVVKGPEESGKLVADRNGSIVGINNVYQETFSLFPFYQRIQFSAKRSVRYYKVSLRTGGVGIFFYGISHVGFYREGRRRM